MIIGDNAGKLKILSYLWQNAEVMPVGDELGILRARRVTRIAGERPSTARWRAELFFGIGSGVWGGEGPYNKSIGPEEATVRNKEDLSGTAGRRASPPGS